MSIGADIQESTRTERTHVVTHGPAYLFGRPLGEILVESFGLPREKLDEALAAQLEKGGRLGEVLISLKAVTDVPLYVVSVFRIKKILLRLTRSNSTCVTSSLIALW